MKKLVFLTIITFLPLSFIYSQILNREFPDAKGNIILLGEVSYERLTEAPFEDWYVSNENAYSPNTDHIASLKKSFNQVDSITIFMGTWCGDSKREVPKITQALKAINFNFNKLKIICVDNRFNNYKQSPENEQAGQNIHRVPTILIHNKKNEIGRMVERPVVSVEKDLLSIVEGSYVPNYQSVHILDKYLKDHGTKWLESNEQIILDSLKPITKKYNELTTYSRVLLTSWKLKEAVTVLEINAKLFPDVEYAHIHLANTYMILGEYEKTEECCKQALEINPESKMAANLLTKIK